MTSALDSFFHWVERIDTPTAVLLLIFLFSIYVAFKAQQRADFDFADMLRGSDGRASSARLAIFVSMAISSWLIVYAAINKGLTDSMFGLYISVWAGAKAVDKGIDAWASVKTGKPLFSITPPADASAQQQPPNTQQ